MIEVTLGRHYYAQHLDIIHWCRQNLGPGGWEQEVEDWSLEDWNWCVRLVFGNTELTFKNKELAAKFAAHWSNK